jgi:hypothetical protein
MQPLHRHPFPHRRVDPAGEAAHVGNDVLAAHEALRIRPLVRKFGQATLPVGGHKAEGIPALPLPGMTDAVPFQHQGANPPPLQTGGH